MIRFFTSIGGFLLGALLFMFLMIISFNPNYLIQGIEVLDGGKAFLRFSGHDKPAVIQGEEETYQYLLMPVRTNE